MDNCSISYAVTPCVMCTCCINSRCGCAQDRICHVVRFWCASGTMQSASCQPTNWPTNVSALAWVLAHCMQTSKLLELRCREPSSWPPAAALRRCMRTVTPLLQWPPQKETVSLQAMLSTACRSIETTSGTSSLQRESFCRLGCTVG